MKRWLPLIVIIIVAAVVRTYRLNEPLADWHSWRQADTVAVTRRYVAEGIDLLHPRYDDLSSIPSGLDNPQGYRMVEFPFVNAFTAWLYQTIPGAGQLEVHVFSRIISIFFSLGSLVFLYLLVHRLSGQLEALLAAAVFALLPYNIFYSRTVLPEVPLVFFSTGALWLLSSWLSHEKHVFNLQFLLAALFSAAALLIKPYAIFLGLPAAYLVFKNCGLSFLKKPTTWVYLVIAFTPFFLWRWWIGHFPAGIPAFTWLLNGNGIRFKGAWFRWLFADRLGRLILGYFGLIPFGLGLIVKSENKTGWFYHIWLLGILAYFTVFATGNVQHDYYQVIAIPVISIFVAKGLAFLLKPPAGFSKTMSYMLLVICAAFMAAFGWFDVRSYFNINHPEIVAAGKAADALLPSEAKVIAPYQGDTAFLYQTNRTGWPIGGDIPAKIKLGATHYVTTSFDDEAKFLLKHCPVLNQTDTFAIIDLRPCRL